jgi:ADP-ribose pyrophosphatase
VTPDPGRSPFIHLHDELVHQGQVVAMYDGHFEGPDGQRLRRDIVRHPGAVSVVALTADDEVFLVRQYRAPIDADLWEIPAGKKDVVGEPPEITAARELREEVGMVARTLEPLIDLHHSPGFCDEYQNIFLASDLTPVEREVDGVEEEHMVVAAVPFAEAIEMATNGAITDAKSIIGILAAARRLGK